MTTITPEIRAKRHIRIVPQSSAGFGIVATVREVWEYRSMLRMLAIRMIRLRYKGSSMGLLWSLILPLVQVFVFTIVFGYILSSAPKNMSAYMLCAFLPWTFFQVALLDTSSSILSVMGTIQKIYIPRELLPIAAVLSNLVHFGAAMLVFLVYRYVLTTIAFHAWPGFPPLAILWLPVVVLIEIMLVTGLGLILCSWTTFYEDVKYFVQVGLSLLFYLVPVIYFSENIMISKRIPPHLQRPLYDAYLLIPIAWIVTAFKQMFFAQANIAPPGQPFFLSAPFDWRFMAITFCTSAATLLIGIAYFNKTKWKFTERP